MTRSDWIGIAGLLVALAFGAPPLLTLLSGEGLTAWAAVALTLATLLLIATLFIMVFLRSPNWSVQESRVHVDIGDPAGRFATFRKELVLRANRPGLDTYIHRSISANGSLDFEVDGGVELVKTDEAAHDYSITVRFPHQSRIFETHRTWLKVECVDSFTKSREGYTLQIDYPLKAAFVKIQFPSERKPRRVLGTYRNSGHRSRLRGVVFDEETGVVSWERRSLFGSLPQGDYEFEWVW